MELWNETKGVGLGLLKVGAGEEKVMADGVVSKMRDAGVVAVV